MTLGHDDSTINIIMAIIIIIIHSLFSVQLSGLFCCWPDGLELVTRTPAKSIGFFWQFLPPSGNFSFY